MCGLGTCPLMLVHYIGSVLARDGEEGVGVTSPGTGLEAHCSSVWHSPPQPSES